MAEEPIVFLDADSAQGGTPVGFRVAVTEPLPVPVSVSWRALALSGGAFAQQVATGRVTIDAGLSETLIDLPDLTDKVVALELFDPAGAVPGRASALRAWSDPADPTVFYVSDPVVRGDAAEAVFDIVLSRPVESGVLLGYITEDGTAVAGAQYVETEGEIWIAPGQQTVQIRVPLIEAASGRFSLLVTPPPGSGLEAGKTVGLAQLRLGSDTPVVRVSDARTGEGQVLVFELSLSAPAEAEIVVGYRLDAGTAGLDDLAPGAPVTGTIRFAAGQTRAYLELSTRGDSAGEGDEALVLILTGAEGASVSETAGLGVLLDPQAGQSPRVLVRPVEAAEPESGQMTTRIPVDLSRPAERDLTFLVSAGGGTATPGQDYVLKDSVLHFSPGQIHGAVAVDVLADALAEGVETVDLILTPTAGTPAGLGESRMTVRLGDPAGPIVGTNADDVLAGGAGGDRLRGLAGDDLLQGNAGDDVLDGGEGNDTAVLSGAMDEYTVTLSPEGMEIAHRAGLDGTDSLIGIERLSFAEEGTLDLTLFDGPAGLSEAEFSALVELYIAYFNRAPDALGLFYWGTRLGEGMTLPEIADSFFVQPETRAAYPDPEDTETFVSTVYRNVLGRAPDADGFAYWKDQLETNPFITPPIFILAIIGGAKAVTGSPADVAYLGLKTELGSYFSVHKGLSSVADAKDVMQLFDGSGESGALAKAAIDDIYLDALDPDDGAFVFQLVGVLDDPFA